MIKTYGCSFTQYRWQTWPDFLRIFFSKQTVENFGIPIDQLKKLDDARIENK